ncbi:MAG: SDR family oxidoreductase [Silicimonas sp.]|nr:SDR family oxidoreductase [Silicimonas sp.]
MSGRALVTGGAKRLGRAMVLYLAERGYDVAIHYNGSTAEAEEVAAEARTLGVNAVTLQADLTEEAQMQALVPRAVDALGQLTLLVNSASIFEHDTVETGTRESWDRHMESNLRAPFVLTQTFAAQAPEPVIQGAFDDPTARALVVNMVDMRVRKLSPHFASYTLAKMGLWALTQTAAQHYGARVRVNAIGPGPTMQGTRQSRDHFLGQRRGTIMGRGADPSDVTHTLGYFIDAPSVTGQLICTDGGQHLGWQTPDTRGIE